MLVPLIVLSVGAIAAGFVFFDYFVGHAEGEFWRGAIFNAATNHVLHEGHEAPLWVKWAPLIASTIGLIGAWYVYILKEGLGARIAQGPLWSFLYNKWFFDEIYDATFVRLARFLGDLFWKGGDKAIIDGLGPDGVSAASYWFGRRTGRLQTGYVYHYAFVMLVGVAALVTWYLVVMRG